MIKGGPKMIVDVNEQNPVSTMKDKQRKRTRNKIIVYILLILGAVIVAYPFFILVLNSFKPGSEIENYPAAWPKHWTFKGYIGVFKQLNILSLFKNSIIISGSVTIINIVVDTVAAYSLAKLNFRGSNVLFQILLGSMMIPGIILLIPTYSMMYHFGWVNTFLPLIVPAAASSYNIFLLRQFIKNIPDAFFEAARIDGCSELRLLWSVVVPMAKPAIAAVSILTFMGSWDDLFNPLLYLHSPKLYTVQLGLLEFKSKIPGPHLDQLWAATTLVLLPVIVVFIVFQKHFVRAFTNVGLK